MGPPPVRLAIGRSKREPRGFGWAIGLDAGSAEATPRSGREWSLTPPTFTPSEGLKPRDIVDARRPQGGSCRVVHQRYL